ncbi:MAG: TetR/AcrR family transcriptional regulator C-terminal domain-containing protein [Chloroflexota bacterium]|nr:TetR/AcrR family transcriptional regulator C-terminal domain-containing protein [Chloroflexota bacterium]
MRRLGQVLGVEAMALYKHVPSKAALLDGMVGAILTELEIPPADPVDWEVRVRAVASAYRRLAHAHPNLFPLVVTRPLNAPEVLRPLEATLDVFLTAGFDAVTTLHAFRALSSYVEGYVLDEITGFSFTAADQGEGPRLEINRLDPLEFPRISELAPHFAEQERDVEFEFGLNALVVGLRAALASLGEEGRNVEPSTQNSERNERV